MTDVETRDARLVNLINRRKVEMTKISFIKKLFF